jgi:subtilisin family serine protease
VYSIGRGIFLIAFFCLFGCAKDNKITQSVSPYCQSRMVKNQFIVHWKDRKPTLIHEAEVQNFIAENESEIQFIEPNYFIQPTWDNPFDDDDDVPADTPPLPPADEPDVIAQPQITSFVYDMIHVRSAWYRGYFGQGLTVAVVDTGVDMKHPSLRRRLIKGYNFIDATEQQNDETGHGTAMAGIITGPYLNEKSLSLAPDVKILPVDFMTADGGTEYYAEQALSYAISKKAKIINNSWTVNCSELLKNAFVGWNAENVIFVNSSGNDPVDVIEHNVMPAALNLSNHIHVGSLDSRGHRSSFSGYGFTVKIYAPGEYVPTFAQSSATARISGTSASTAIVTAGAALLWSAYPKASAHEIVSLLIDGALQEPTIEPMLNIQQSLSLGRERFGN